MTSSCATLRIEEDRLMISGDLTFSTTTKLLNESLPFLKNLSAITIDFSNVQSSNSAGLALIIEWLKWAKENKKTISFTAIPEGIAAVTKVCGLEKIIFPQH